MSDESVHVLTTPFPCGLEPGARIVMADGSVWEVTRLISKTTFVLRPFPWWRRLWAWLCLHVKPLLRFRYRIRL